MTSKDIFKDAFPQDKQIGGNHYQHYLIQPYEFISKNEGGDDSNKSQKSPRFLTEEIVKDLNEDLEKGKAQLEQLVDSEELQQGLENASAEFKQVLDSGALQTGLKNTAANAKPIVEGLKRQFDNIDTQAFKAIGQEIILGSGVQAAVANTKSTNKIKNSLKNTLSEVKNSIPKDKFKSLASAACFAASKPPYPAPTTIKSKSKEISLTVFIGYP